MTSRFVYGMFLVLALSLLAGSSLSAAPFPLNFNLDSLQRADKQPSAFEDHLVAFKGIVTQYRQLSDGLPYFFVQLPTPNPKNDGLWVKGFANAKPGDIQVGHLVVILGYFMATDPKDKAITDIHKKPYHIAGLCVANGTTQTGIYAKEANSICAQWQNGTIPQVAPADPPKAKVIAPAEKK